MPAYNPTAAAHGGFDPNVPPKSDYAASIERNAETATKNAEGRQKQIVAETNHNITAAMDQRPARRPFLRATPSGRVLELWGPIAAREAGAYSRVTSRLDGAPEVGQTRDALIAAALDAGAKREKIPEDLAESLAQIEHRDALAEASRAGVHLAGSMTAGRLSSLARENKRALYAAVHEDLAEVVADAHRCARALEGVDSAETAIALGNAAVTAWGAREAIRARMLAVAESARFVHRAVTDGFTYLGGEPDELTKAGLSTEGSTTTWDLIDGWLEDLGTKDAAVDLLVGR